MTRPHRPGTDRPDGERLVQSYFPSRAQDVTRQDTLTDYKNVMTKNVLSLPHLLRGEQLPSSLPRESEAILSRGHRRRGPAAPSPCPDCPPARQASPGYGGASWTLRSGLSGLPRPQPYRHGVPGWACYRPSGARTFPARPLPGRPLTRTPICALLPDFLPGDFRLKRNCAPSLL